MLLKKLRSFSFGGLAAAALALLTGSQALAQEATTAAATDPMAALNSGDVAWMLMSTALVLLMTPGLGFFYAGMVRTKNAVATLMQSMFAISLLSVIWYVCGYSMAFAPGSSFLGGFQWAFFKDVGVAPNADYAGTIPHSLFAVFQCMFAVITPALIAGAFAERIKFSAYCLFIAAWSLLVYSPVAHWVWGVGGFLRNMGVLDFAGGIVVHQIAGFSALAAALVIGKRTDYGKADTSPHNIPFIALGTGLLWFGWFGFNAGSALGSGGLATSAFTSTHMGAAGAGLAWAVADKMLKGKVNLTGLCIGMVVGLVAVTPGAGFISPTAGLIVGLVGGAAANFVAYLRGKSQLDDSLDVFACHGVGGFVGTVLTGVFASKAINAAGADGGATQVLTQIKASLIAGVFAFAATYIVLKVIDMVVGLRPSTENEVKGLDHSEHNEKAYLNN